MTVTSYVNEEEISIPRVEANGGDFLAAFEDIVNTCNLDLMCRP